MINFAVFEKLWERFPPQEAPFLTELRANMRKIQPYKNLRILHNVVLATNTLLKIEPFLLGGADIVVSSPQVVNAHPQALAILKEANIPVIFNHHYSGKFDVCLDCCAELINVVEPAFGTSELTRTGSKIYHDAKLSYPVISVDDCKVKCLETVGTGESFVKAFMQLTGKEIQQKKFLVFGYGKVSRGIVHALLKYTDKIVVIEETAIINSLTEESVSFLPISEANLIKKELKDTLCAVTATGVENCISANFTKEDFNGVYLANMGAVDEFGYKFSAEDVLFNKLPINFALEEPTALRYIDPIFYAHNIAVDLLISSKLNNTYYPFPEAISNKILSQWADYYEQDISQII